MTKADRTLVRDSHQIIAAKANYDISITLYRVQRLLAIVARQELLLRRYRTYLRTNASAGVRRALEQP